MGKPAALLQRGNRRRGKKKKVFLEAGAEKRLASDAEPLIAFFFNFQQGGVETKEGREGNAVET